MAEPPVVPPAQRATARTRRVMLDVLIALIPGIAVHAWSFGPGILLQLALASVFALAFEAAMLAARGRPLAPALGSL